MKSALFILVCLVFLASALCFVQNASAAVKIRPVQIVSCAPLPEGLDFELKPAGYEKGFKIYYLIEGENIAGIKEDSLIIDSITTKEGKDISRYQNGNPAYKQSNVFFSNFSDDGKYSEFSIQVDQDQFGSVGSLSLNGSIIVLTASNKEQETIQISSSVKQPKKAGSFQVSIPKGGGLADSFGGVRSGGAIKVEGPLDRIIKVFLETNNGVQESDGYESDSESIIYYFKDPGSVVQINYWTDLREERVNFSL